MDCDEQLAMSPKRRSCPPFEQGPPKRRLYTLAPTHFHPSSPFSFSGHSPTSSISDQISSHDDYITYPVRSDSLDKSGSLFNCDQLGNLSVFDTFLDIQRDSQTPLSNWTDCESYNHGFEEENVCFGMVRIISKMGNRKTLICIQLCNVAVRLRTEESRQSVSNRQDPVVQVGKRRFRRLNFMFQNGRCDLATEEEEKIAVLNMASFRALEALKTEFFVELEGLLELSDGNYRYSRSIKKSEHPLDAKLDIVIRGRRRFANNVAEMLCQADHFLEDPYWNPGPMPYENPQYLELSGLPMREDDLIHGEETLTDSPNGLMPDFMTDLDQIIDQFARHDYLDQAHVDPKITTNLMRSDIIRGGAE